MTHNHRLREKRIRRSWRQEDLAEHLGISVTTVQRWERGSQHPTLYYRVKLCELFEASAQELGLLDDALPPETSPSLDPPPPAEDNALWTVPYQRNPHFTGREDLLAMLFQHFASSLPTPNSGRRAPLPQAYAPKGLGGIGKTQMALEYVYRSHEQGRYRHTLWMPATSEESLLASFAALREQISLDVAPGTDQRIWARHVICWLEHCHDPWLLIMDNADDLSVLSSYLPAARAASCLPRAATP
ncbi:hypothetical protein KSF_105060 [Reticulibacter mediterranei]|uniref:HTH cro/C1-type domain-containing protein n=1 Tax=Reticulibacter mediterranei TaxID=2778369 RepID=A0A8J3ITV2_9CHLR|nr:helix-turn-helix domain-containing protein [Reticulibacter mediterranei]GHP00459.1 hypothetical protein KSF_105060 [Reticulibacter mediterranei]